ncbi:MAG: M24 family metallopeptidase [Halobacteriaceae archaeon]
MTPFERRTRRLQERLGDDEAVVLFPSPNLYYLTGTWEEPSERVFHLLVGPAGDPILVAPELAAGAVREDTWLGDVRSYGDDEEPEAIIQGAAAELGIDDGRLAVDPTMWALFTEALRDVLPAATLGLADEHMTALRIRKDDRELAAMRKAATIADDVSETIRALGDEVIGWTETELAAEIESRLTDHGGEALPFPIIAAAGPNAARPHHTNGDRTIEAGDPVVLDFGTTVDHYPSDQTRTVVFDGQPTAAFEEAFEAVRAAQAAAIDVIEPGITTGDIDRAARSVIEDHGYGAEFIHRTGHGVGLSVHEPPYITADGTREVAPGMVFSVEPGVYREGEFGVRIEDLVVVTEDGAERLNDSPRHWRATPTEM